MGDVKRKAKELGVKAGKMRKVDLVRAIQANEGNTPCFQTGITSCDQDDCCWRTDCVQ